MKGRPGSRLWIVVCLLLAGMLVLWVFGLLADLPSLDQLAEPPQIPSIRITDRAGRLMYEVLAREGGRHTLIALDAIPETLVDATIATEDSSFFENPGVDLRGILRAVWINLQGGETLAGGSTITQQVARNLLLEAGERQERTLRRKLRESLLAWQLAHAFSKEEILSLYLNHMYYGALAYGVEAAAQTYFGKPAVELDLAESALLAGLPQAPAYYDPFSYPERAKARQVVVLDLMLKQGMIEPQERELAEQERLVYTATPYPIEAPHFVFWVRDQLTQLVSKDALYRSGGLIVRTTLDLDWQHHAERIIQGQLQKLNQPGVESQGHRVRNAALVALEPHSGEILSMVGSPDFFSASIQGAINMALAPRQPGSAFKPLIYAAAMDPAREDPWTAATMILDVHAAFITHDGQAYAPVNFDLEEHGPVSLRRALGSSLNIPAVRTLNAIGLEPVLGLSSKVGITTFGDPDIYDLSLALGGGEVRLLELTAAYGVFANGGSRVDPIAILEIQDAQGSTLFARDPIGREQVLDPRVAWLISDILSDKDARTLGFGANSVLQIDRPAAVKTGTTTDFRDNWTIGYTPDLVVGVWVGNTDNQPMLDVTGLSGAAPVWHQFMRTVEVGQPELVFGFPSGLVRVEVCALSGLLPTEACAFTREEWFIRGTEPTRPDNLYRQVIIDTDTMCYASETTAQGKRARRVVLNLPPEAAPWARSQGLSLAEDFACEQRVDFFAADVERLRIIAPDDRSVFQLSPAQPLESQRLRIEAVSGEPLREVKLWLDGELLAEIEGTPYIAWWTLSLGLHQVWAEGVADSGERVVSETVYFEVLAEGE